MKLKELPRDLKSKCYCDYTLHLINSPPASINFPNASGRRSFSAVYIPTSTDNLSFVSIWRLSNDRPTLPLCGGQSNKTFPHSDIRVRRGLLMEGKLFLSVHYLDYLGAMKDARFRKRVANYYQTE